VNVLLLVNEPSLTVAVTEYVPTTVGVPLLRPQGTIPNTRRSPGADTLK
jgi:hypothetical protein